MRITYGLLAAGVIALAIPALPAGATLITFSATLTGAGENPPNASPATGTLTAQLNTVADTLDVSETFFGLTAAATAAHIHCCAGSGTNAPVVLNFVGVGFPVGSTSGTFSHTFDLTTDLIGIALSTFITGLESGTAYGNIHDANFPGGEIRGQLTEQVGQVPEPATLSLVFFGVGALAVARGRKKTRSP